MKCKSLILKLSLSAAVCGLAIAAAAQTANVSAATATATATSTIPRLINYSGILKNFDGKTLTTISGVTFLLYKDEQGGAPLWLETQNVTPDKTGHYSVQLGTTSAHGLSSDLFVSGEARWLAVQVANDAEQARVLLVAVPYAMKAADAETIGGLPPSAFVLAAPPSAATTLTSTENISVAPSSFSAPPPASSNVTTTGGAANRIPLFTTATNIQNSILTQSGTAAINVGGKLNLPATGTATAAVGKNSQPLTQAASSFNSSTSKAVSQLFQWQAEPAGNDTATPSGTLNLLYGSGAATPAETGLRLSSMGIFTFASGQTFPDSSAAFPADSRDSAYFGGAGNSTSSGSDDTASGFHALASNKTGSLDTALGYSAGPDPGSTGLTNATAIGANATVSQSNSLVLGKTTAGSPGASHVNVGIGTATPASALEVSVKASGALGPTLTLTNPGGAGGSPTNQGTATSIDFNSYLPAAEPEGTLPEARIEAVDNGAYSDGLIFYTKFVSGASSFLQQDLTIQANGQTAVGLPTSGTLPTLTAQLTVFDTGPKGFDGIDTTGGAEVGSGISATGGAETASSSIQGGTGGSFTGGFSPGTTGDGIFATPGDATFSTGAGWAGLFVGDIDVTGAIFAGVKDFKIDHPLDPANKYLVHASVESSEMMNIYSGNVVTDELGLATVKLPDWFEAENTDFRYQLTVIGGRFAQAIVSKEIADHQFTISTNASNVKVSWQVTAVREDDYARAHPLVVEQQKPADERGFYQNPELFGQPAEKQTEWGRHPQQMQHMKAMREQQKLQRQRTPLHNALPPR